MRFISEDTYEGRLSELLSLNLYTYCHNNPIIYVDPSGHFIVGIGDRYENDIRNKVHNILDTEGFRPKTYDSRYGVIVAKYEGLVEYKVGYLYDYGSVAVSSIIKGAKEGGDLYSKAGFAIIYLLDGLIQTATGPGAQNSIEYELDKMKYKASNLGDYAYLMRYPKDRREVVEVLELKKANYMYHINLIKVDGIDLEKVSSSFKLEYMEAIVEYIDKLIYINENYSKPPIDY